MRKRIFNSPIQNYKYAEDMWDLFMDIPVGLATVNNENFLLRGNNKFFEIVGYSENDFGNIKITDILLEDPLEIIKESNGRKRQVEFKNKKGVFSIAEVSIKPLLDKEGELINYFLSIYEIKKIESNKTQFPTLANILDQSESSIIITDINAKIFYVNPVFCEITGYTSEEVTGKNIDIFKAEEMNHDVLNELWDTILNGEIWRGEIINKKKNGERYPGYTIIVPVKGNYGSINYFIVIKENLVSFKQQQKKREEIDRLASIGKMASFLLHEIKTPFASIKMNFELIKRNITDNKLSFNIIDRELNRLDKMLNDVLQFSRDKELEIVNVNLCTSINYSLELLDQFLKSKKIKFYNNLPSIIIKADSQQINSLFVYLLENSIDAINYSGEIEVWAVTEDSSIFIYYKDSGCGIDNSIAHKIFEPFFTNKAKGSGLGLALAKRIVEKHSGTIELYNGKQGETTFKIKIPLGR